MQLPIDPTILILGAISTVTTLFYVFEYNKRKKVETQGDKFLQDIKQKGYENLSQSVKKSQAIIAESELEGIKFVADSKIEVSKLEQEYFKKFQELLDNSQKNINAAENQLIQFIQELQRRSQELEEGSRQTAQTRVDQMFQNFESRLSNFLISTEEKTTSSIELELKATRNLIESYKQQQLNLIDENIIAIMEQTLNLVLGKKLSLKDQLDLVYEALEKAKIEKFII